MHLRETASIVVAAPPERVAVALERREARRVAPDRFESERGTFVLREAAGGTRVVHARAEPGLALGGPREALRHRVEAELRLVRRLVEAE